MMILTGMDYLTIPVRFGQTGEIIQEGNLWLELDDSPSEFRESTVWGGWGGEGSRGKHFQTQENWGLQQQGLEIMWNQATSDRGIYHAWFLSLKYNANLSKSHIQSMQTKMHPTGLHRTPVWGSALDPPMESLPCLPGRVAAVLLHRWLPTWATFPFQMPFPNPSPSLLRPSHSHLSLRGWRGWTSCACETAEAKIKVATSMNQNDEIAFVTLVFCYLTSVYVFVAGQLSSSLSIQDTRLFFSSWFITTDEVANFYLTEPVTACESIKHPWVKSVET